MTLARYLFTVSLALFVPLTMGCGGDADVHADATVDIDSLLTVQTLESLEETTLSRARTYRGQVEAKRRSEVGFDLSGTVVRMVVDEGDRVERGALLAVLDTSRLEARWRQLDSAVAEAATRLELAESTLTRFKRAAERSAVSPQDVDEAQRGRDAAAAALARTEAERDLVRVDQSKSLLRAPYRAIVTARHVDEGQVVSPGGSVLSLIEIDKPRVRIGMPVDATGQLPASDDKLVVDVNGRSWEARRLSLASEQNQRTRTVDLLLELDEPLGEVRVGETATLELAAGTPVRGYVLPLEALTESSRGLWSALAVVADEEAGSGVWRVEQRPVEIVEVDTAAEGGGARALVRGALEPGDRLVARGLQRLVAGQHVLVDTETVSVGAQEAES